MKLRGVSLVNAICLISAVNAYRGADNRLVAGYQDERRFHERRPPEIEYHYPDNMSNQISRQHSLPGNAFHSWRHQPAYSEPEVVAGTWRKTVPSVGYVNHIKLDRRKPLHRSTAGMYRTSQWGTARIPYPGASVNVVPAQGRKKTYRGLVTTTVLSPDEIRRGHSLAATVDADSSRGLAQDEPAVPDPCYKCPADRAVVATKGTKYAPLEKPTIKPCHQRSWTPEVKLELLSGIRPGFPLSEGAHVITARLVFRQKTLETCRFRYNVVVRRCPPLMLPDHLVANCSTENAWGSKCHMSCRRGYHPLGPSTTECDDNQRWTQPLPTCITTTGCATPMSPENGRLSCKMSDDDKGDLLAEGTTCRYACNEGYSLPNIQAEHKIITCSAGEWNTTVDSNCQADFATRPSPQATVGETTTDRKRHRKHRNGRPKASDPCRPNPCENKEKCQPGPQPFIALCSCPAGVPEHVDGQPCHKMVLVKRLMEGRERRKSRDTLVLGNVYGVTSNTGLEVEA